MIRITSPLNKRGHFLDKSNDYIKRKVLIVAGRFSTLPNNSTHLPIELLGNPYTTFINLNYYLN